MRIGVELTGRGGSFEPAGLTTSVVHEQSNVPASLDPGAKRGTDRERACGARRGHDLVIIISSMHPLTRRFDPGRRPA
jgi:hypothetical protein